ncbi:MAG: DUF4157 domain-containing protein [Kofleriaceae bacterium]
MGDARVLEPRPRSPARRSADAEVDAARAPERGLPGPGKLTRSDGHVVAAGARPVGKLTRTADATASSAAQALAHARFLLADHRGWSHVQRRATSDGADPERGALASAFGFLAESRGPQPLPAELARRLSESIELDASRVRIHTDEHAAAAATLLHARAFTIGDDIYFAQGSYDPHSEAGLELLAHEVAHVAQHQRGALDGARGVSRPGDTHEHQADELARRFLRQRREARRGAEGAGAATRPPARLDDDARVEAKLATCAKGTEPKDEARRARQAPSWARGGEPTPSAEPQDEARRARQAPSWARGGEPEPHALDEHRAHSPAPAAPTPAQADAAEHGAPNIAVLLRRAPATPTTPGTGHLVEHLLAAIDASARKGLAAVDDPRGRRDAAAQVVARVEHLLSITAVPDGGASVAGAARSAARALGRAAALAAVLRARDPAAAERVAQALLCVETELAPSAKWRWKPEAAGDQAGGGLTRREGAAIGRETLAVVRSRAEAALRAQKEGPILATAAAIAEDLGHANRELALALAPGQALAYRDDMVATGQVLARFEAVAHQRGVGERPALAAMRSAETALRATLGLAGERASFESALPALDAILDIVTRRIELRDGVAYDRSQPAAHAKAVPARYLPLLEQWFQVTHGRVRQLDGSLVTTRGRELGAALDRALAATKPLLDAVRAEGDPAEVEPWLERLFTKVAEFRARATRETVSDLINDQTDKALADHASPVDQLDDEAQVLVASQQLLSISRQGVSVLQRLASSEKSVLDAAAKAFENGLANVDLPDACKTRLASAHTLADIAQHLAGLANGVVAALTLTDPEQRRRMLEKEFGVHAVTGVTQLAKQALWIVQGGVASYNLLSASLLVARGQTSAAAQLLAASGKTLGRVSLALSALNVAHGLFLAACGEGAARLDGAVEATWGALGLLSKMSKTMPRFTGPLSAALAISHLTIKSLGNAAVGSLYGMVQLGLNSAYQDMQRVAREVHGAAMRLTVALTSGAELAEPALAAELAKQVAALRWNLRELGLRAYLERTKQRGAPSDPGTYPPLRERFRPLWGAPMGTDLELLTTTELFLMTVVHCFDDAQQVLEEAVAASLKESR